MITIMTLNGRKETYEEVAALEFARAWVRVERWGGNADLGRSRELTHQLDQLHPSAFSIHFLTMASDFVSVMHEYWVDNVWFRISCRSIVIFDFASITYQILTARRLEYSRKYHVINFFNYYVVASRAWLLTSRRSWHKRLLTLHPSFSRVTWLSVGYSPRFWLHVVWRSWVWFSQHSIFYLRL
jgi:hypothetical protein